MATKTITSEKSVTPVGNAGTKLYTSTRTTYTLDETGKINPNTVKQEILYTQIPGDPPIVAATRNGSTGDFTFTKNSFTGKTYFGADAQKSLKEGALKTTTNQQIQQSTKKEGLTPEQTKSLSSANANTATTDPNAFKLSQSASGANLVNALGEGIKDGSIRKDYGHYSYPKPFPKQQDRIKFSMFRYSPKSLDIANFATGSTFGSRELKNPMGSVTLPIQPQISDTSSVDWGNDDMNALSALAALASYNSITKDDGVGQTIDAVAKGLKGSTGSLASAAAASLAGAAAGGNKNFLSRATGAILNPNFELLFNGPQIRTFSFNFTLSAREDDEAKEIKKIIRFFKQGMSVKREDTGLFLKAPNIFDVKYILGNSNKDHPWINQIKTCALVNFSVDYTPAGNYATFYDGAMTQYNLTMSFSELDPIYEDDFANDSGKLDDDSFIGY
tara:strand:+ start:13947 stop:15281 length:1335 start_codon:yes stop_codon:yes gene_type:complete